MAKWAWGDGKTLVDVDAPGVRVERQGCRLFDGGEEVLDFVDFVDEEAGTYRILVTEPPGQKFDRSKGGNQGTSFRFNEDHTEVVREMRRAKAGLKVFMAGEAP